MNFFKTSFWASLTTGLNIVCGFITTKIIALRLGPEGLALTGQFSNFTVLIGLFATAACANGVIKYVSEFQTQEGKQKVVLNAFVLALFGSLILSLLTISFSKYLSLASFNNEGYTSVYIIYGIVLFFVSVNTITLAILNGLGLIHEMAKFSITVSLLNVVCVVVSSSFLGIKAVLLSNTIANAIAFVLYNSRLHKLKIHFQFRIENVDRHIILKLLHFSIMAVISGVLAPLLQIYVRSKIISNFNLGSAGVWQATTKLSDYYLNFVYSVLSIYYLPKLSSLQELKLIRREIYNGYIRIVPAVAVFAMFIWLFRDSIIHIAFTSEFFDVVYLLKWQLIGDVIKVSSFILGYLLISKGYLKTYIIIEVLFALLFVVLSALFIRYFGIIGSVYAFAMNYLIYLVTLVIVLRKYLFIS